MLVALGTLASAQTKGTEATTRAAAQLLDYAATHPAAVLQFKASNMVLHVHSDASYLSKPDVRSRAGGLFFLSTFPSAGAATISRLHSTEPFTSPAVSCATFLHLQRKPRSALCSTIVKMRACYAPPLTNWNILNLLHQYKLIMHAPK